MQWHPIFIHLLRPLVESHFEVRTNQSVGELPRHSDAVLLHKTAMGPAPFQGLWRRLTPWNLLEYKGPTVSPRFDELHEMLELGLGIYRRLNELQSQAREPRVDYAEMSFWYLVNHLGSRFLADVRDYLPGIQQQAAGLWQATVFQHPVFLVSVQELAVERDSLALHVLAGVPEAARNTVVAALQAEPGLWPNYGAWLSLKEPAIWQEIFRMATQQGQESVLSLGPLADYLRKGGRVEDFKTFVEAYGIKQAFEEVGPEQFWAALSPEQREELLRLAHKDQPPAP